MRGFLRCGGKGGAFGRDNVCWGDRRANSFARGVIGGGAGGLKRREGGGFGWWSGFRGAGLVLGHSEELGDDAGAGFFDFDSGREGAVGGVEGDLFDGLDLGCGPAAGLGFGEIQAGDLETVEEQAGAAGVDVVGCDAAEDFADRVLDGAAVFGLRDAKGRAATAALAGVLDRLAGGVVVVAKFFLA
jgi:hypothetical protein